MTILLWDETKGEIMQRTKFPKPKTQQWKRFKAKSGFTGYWCQRYGQCVNSEICRSKIDMHTNGCRKCGGCPEPVEGEE